MKRQAHYLRTVKGGTIPPCIICVGVSGVPGSGGAWAAEACTFEPGEIADGDSSWGGCQRSFWSTLEQAAALQPGCWVVMLGAVDCLTALGFWDILEECKWEISCHDERVQDGHAAGTPTAFSGLAVLQDPPTIVVARPANSGGTIKFVDLRNYGIGVWPEINAAGVYEGPAEANAKGQAAAVAACVRQIVETVARFSLGSLKTTAASQAMHAYRSRFLSSLVLCHDNLPALGLERAAMFGGRCEAWRLGAMPRGVYHLDFKAHYPSVVLGELMPARLKGHVLGCEPSPQSLMSRGYLVISEVTLDTSENNYPVRFSQARHARAGLSAHRGKGTVLAKEGDLVYPVGRFTTALCGPELSLAFSRGHVARVNATAWYEPSELFTRWAGELGIAEEWAKANCVPGVRRFIKRVRNSLFGKFGQWDWAWVDAPDAVAMQPYGVWYGGNPAGGPAIRYRSVGWHCQQEKLRGESKESCPAIAAWVYSLARVRLLQAIECAGRDNVYYMDADSIWCNHDGFRSLDVAGWIHPNLPGKLAIKGQHESVTIYGLKQYVCDGLQTHAGIPHGTTGTHLQGWQFNGMEKLGQSLPHGRPPGQQAISYTVRPSGVYRHGIVDVSGRVLPYVLREDG